MNKNPHAVALGKRAWKKTRKTKSRAELREHMAAMGRKSSRRRWLHDPDPSNEWWWIEGLPIGVMREEDGSRWTPAYQDDGLPAGVAHPTKAVKTDYIWYRNLVSAKASAMRLNRAEHH